MQPLYSTATKDMIKIMISAFFGILVIINKDFGLLLFFIVLSLAGILITALLIKRKYATNNSVAVHTVPHPCKKQLFSGTDRLYAGTSQVLYQTRQPEKNRSNY